MLKLDLIRVALTELRKQWNVGETMEWFDTTDYGANEDEVYIKWNPKVTPDSQGFILPKAVTISRKKDGRFSCVILDTASSNSIPHMHRNEKTIYSEVLWYWQWTKINREFNALRKKIVQYKRMKENNSFLSDLLKVFPQSMDGALLGSEYDE